MSSEIEKFSKSQKPSKNLMHPASAADHFSLYEEGTSSGPLQYGLLWDYGFGRTHFPAGGLIRASRGIFYLPALLPPARDPPLSPLPLSPVPSGAEGGSECAAPRGSRLHCRGPRFFLRGSARCDRPTKQAPVLCFYETAKN